MKNCWVILAAGRGTRLVSSVQQNVPKPFLTIRGKPMVAHIMDSIPACDLIVLVICQAISTPEQEVILDDFRKRYPNMRIADQGMPLGTGHAFRTALEEVPHDIDRIHVLNGDCPAVPVRCIREMERGSWVVLAPRHILPFADAMGRYCMETGRIQERPADKDESDLVNTGVYILENSPALGAELEKLPLHKEKGEYYLTDILCHFHIQPLILSDVRFQGINTIEEWRFVESILV